MLSGSRRTAWLQITGSAGILAPLLGFTFVGLAIASYPQFSWVDNALSDLGVVSGTTSTLFNFGLYLSGLLFFIFSAGLFTYLGDRILGKIGSTIFVLASLSLEGIGTFTENSPPYHFIFSVAFFTLMPIALLLIMGHYAVSRQKRMTVFTLSVAVAAALPWVLLFLFPYAPGVAIPELISALAGATWVVFLGYKMIREASDSKNA